MTKGLHIVIASLVAGLLIATPQGVARTKAYPDPVGDNRYCRGNCDIKRVVVSDMPGDRVRFKVDFHKRFRFTNVTIHIKAKGKSFRISSGGIDGEFDNLVKTKDSRRRYVISFPLSPLGDPGTFRWQVEAAYVDVADFSPSQWRYGRWKVESTPLEPDGPALRGPGRVNRGNSVAFQAWWFTPGTPLSVAVKPLAGKGVKQVDQTFTAKNGRTPLRFKFPNVTWTSETRVSVCGLPPGKTEQECAGRTVKIQKPKLPKVYIPFRHGKGRFTVDGKSSEASAGKLTITKGKTNLVKPQRYRAPAGGKDKIILRLTKAGKKALAKTGQAEGTLTLTGTNGKSAKFAATLKRKSR